MSRRSRFFRSGLMGAVGAFVVGIAFFAVPAQEGYASTTCSSECYVVTPVTPPASAAAGTGQTYTFQVTNNDKYEHLKSLTFTAPADFAITAASAPGETSVSHMPAPSVTLGLPSDEGSTFTVAIMALAPCTTTRPEVWGVHGTDSLGEKNEVGWSSSPLSTPVTGQCGLEFTGEPAQTAIKSNITTAFNSNGSPLAVQLLDAKGNPLSTADVSANGTDVTISISANPGGGTLAGKTTMPSSTGVATFGNLQINNPGTGYDLAATATGFTSGTSSLFMITGLIQECGTSCSALQSSADGTVTSITSGSASGDFAALSLGGVSFGCTHYKSVSDTATFGIFNSTGGSIASASATVTLTISPAAVASSPRPLIFWQVCYASPTPFPVIPGTGGTTTIAGVTYHTGLLLPCFLFGPGHPEACLISQRRENTGAVTLTFVALGDPFYRG